MRTLELHLAALHPGVAQAIVLLAFHTPRPMLQCFRSVRSATDKPSRVTSCGLCCIPADQRPPPGPAAHKLGARTEDDPMSKRTFQLVVVG
ncbi:hypothetical protein PAXRUDRAFT_250745 [Paxillus rubicundulus Ve08.2h10]|uniref:Unplaced genomic scaffold scaffold_129, whole genome shotgun sequence n=1 Tax=Paxillus rubicundulus Ve08.2h10 TaxID=930991 RepID=A0A0D0E0T2_9AGAM|nr:hypothetical protein PAXRUDRAFT_250745 [Paxillus rubicundulus Ve08.2h10]